MTTKNVKKTIICSTPEVVPFEFRQAQQLYTEITIVNLVEFEITYKIKTNKPGLYLVKPMEGRIQKKDKIKITFKRKQLSLKDYLAIVANDSVNKEKFLIEINSQVVDPMGISENLQQIAYLGVKFTPPTHATQPSTQLNTSNTSINHSLIPHKSPKAHDKKHFQKILTEKKRQLEQQIKIKQNLQSVAQDPSPSRNQFTLNDLINLIIVAFLLGFII